LDWCDGCIFPLLPPTLPLVSGVATSDFRFFRYSVVDPAALAVGVGKSEEEKEDEFEDDDDDDEVQVVEEDKFEEAAFDLKRAQIAFINILPRKQQR
jgi:hypothetical protein